MKRRRARELARRFGPRPRVWDDLDQRVESVVRSATSLALMKDLLKRSRTIHSLYKLLRRLPEAPPWAWADFHRTRSIVKVLPNTMLSGPRLINAYDCMRTIEQEGLTGDVAECGVWAGGGIGVM